MSVPSLSQPRMALPRAVARVAFAFAFAMALVLVPQLQHVAHAEPMTTFEGRDVLSHTHIDAAHVHEKNGELEVGVIQGENTLRQADDVVLRLGPDANSDGEETSRIVVPDEPSASFLGKPGEVKWNAPQKLNWDWAPLWPGIGAGEISDAFQTDSLRLHLDSVDGPGGVEVYFVDYTGTFTRELSSKDEKFSSRVIHPREHGHFNWAFDEPGRYAMTFSVSGKRADGSDYRSKQFTVQWLVGTDKQLGLPEGSWEPANEITSPVAPLPEDDGSGEPAPEDPKPEDPAPEDPKPEDPADPKPENPAPPQEEERLILDHGHVDMFHVQQGEDGNPALFLTEDVTGSHVAHEPKNVELHVKSAAKTDIPEKLPGAGEGFLLPETQNPELLWPGWDTQPVAGTDLDKRIDLRFTDVSGPGKVFLWRTKGFGGVESALESGSTQLTSGEVIAQKSPAHSHANWVFSKPGVYTFTVEAVGTRDGSPVVSEAKTYTITVGDEFRGADAPSESVPSDPAEPNDPAPADPQPGDDGEGSGDADGSGSGSGDGSGVGGSSDSGGEPGASDAGGGGSGSSGGNSGAGGRNGGLARTGAEIAPAAGVAFALLAGGAALMAARRTQRPASPRR